MRIGKKDKCREVLCEVDWFAQKNKDGSYTIPGRVRDLVVKTLAETEYPRLNCERFSSPREALEYYYEQVLDRYTDCFEFECEFKLLKWMNSPIHHKAEKKRK